LSRAGEVLSHVGHAGTFRDPRLSPDGRHVAVARADENGIFSIWTYDLARNIDSRATGATFVSPAWGPGGRWILVGNAEGLHRFDIGMGGPGTLVRSLTELATVGDVHPDGREAVVQSSKGLASIALDGCGDDQLPTAERSKRPKLPPPDTPHGLLPWDGAVLDERPLAELLERLAQFRLGVHDDRSVPCYGLLEGLA